MKANNTDKNKKKNKIEKGHYGYIDNAKRKALTMTNAAQVSLGDIVSMDYSYETFYWESRQYVHMDCDVMCKADTAFDVDMTPEDANIADTVTIVWEIK